MDPFYCLVFFLSTETEYEFLSLTEHLLGIRIRSDLTSPSSAFNILLSHLWSPFFHKTLKASKKNQYESVSFTYSTSLLILYSNSKTVGKVYAMQYGGRIVSPAADSQTQPAASPHSLHSLVSLKNFAEIIMSFAERNNWRTYILSYYSVNKLLKELLLRFI